MEDLLPSEYYLSQNHPNPFRKRTVIKYCIPEEVNVRLEIFDDKMRKVKTLVDEAKEPGTYQIEFNSQSGLSLWGEVHNLSSGVYLYQLQAGDPSTSSGRSFVETKKMILIK